MCVCGRNLGSLATPSFLSPPVCCQNEGKARTETSMTQSGMRPWQIDNLWLLHPNLVMVTIFNRPHVFVLPILKWQCGCIPVWLQEVRVSIYAVSSIAVLDALGDIFVYYQVPCYKDSWKHDHRMALSLRAKQTIHLSSIFPLLGMLCVNSLMVEIQPSITEIDTNHGGLVYT